MPHIMHAHSGYKGGCFVVIITANWLNSVYPDQAAPLRGSGSSLFERCHEKTNVLVSDLVQHKPGCTATEDG